MSNLLRLIGRRLIAFPIMVVGVTLLVFLVMAFSPADPAQLALGESASDEAKALYRAEHGLDDPLMVRYASSWPACCAATWAPPAATPR